MKKTLLSLLILIIGFATFYGQNSPGFKYQAVVRDSSGEIIAEQSVRLRISILKGSVNGDAVLKETFTTTTNEFGLVNIVVGSIETNDFAAIDWSDDNYFIKVELDDSGGTDYTTMGTSQLLSVPYAQYAFSAGEWKNVDETVYTLKNVGIGTDSPTGRLKIVEEDDAKADDPIFEVVNNNGETVFAVYHNRVEINFEDDGSDKARGGFAVSGRTSSKEDYHEYFTINADETRVYVDDPGDKARGGFAVSGRTSTKEELQDIFRVQPGLTQVFVDQAADKARGGFAVSGRTSTKDLYEDIFTVQPGLTQVFVDHTTDKARGGFAVSGRTSSKELYDDIFTVKPGLTQVFVDETTSKARGGFAVSGRTSTKEDGIYDVISVRPERTDIFVNPSPDKFFADGFSISLYDDLFDHTELFAVSEEGAVVNVGMAIAPRVRTIDIIDELITETSASAIGYVVEYGGTPIVSRGVVYSVDPRPHLTVDIDNPPLDPSHSGVVFDDVGGFGSFEANIFNLEPGTTYYVSAFAENEDKLVGFGEIKSFTTVVEPSTYTVTLLVTESLDGTPVEGALVNLTPYEVGTKPIAPEFEGTTNAEGLITFEDVPQGEYEYYVNSEDGMAGGFILIDENLEQPYEITVEPQKND